MASLLVLLAAGPAELAPAHQRRRSPVSPADGATGHEQAEAELVGRALMSADDEAREDAVRRLPEVAAALALPALQQAMFDRQARVRSAAVDALADIAGDAALGLLAAALVDSMPDVREDAVYALGRVGGPLAQAAIAMATTDPDPFVREAAIQVSKELARRRVPRPVRPRVSP